MSAPSFSSFPPSFGSFPDVEQENNKASSSKQQRKEEEPLRSKKDKDRERDGDKHREKRARDGKRRKDTNRHSKRNHAQYDDERAKQEEDRNARLGTRYDGGTPGLFVVDKVGDPMNIVYGGIHAGDIPRYRRVGFGNVLGLGKAFKIVTRGTGGKSLEIGINGRRPAIRYTDPHSLALLTNTRTRHILPASSNPKGNDRRDIEVGSQAEYIRLPSRRGRPTNEPLSTYRSIHPSRDADANSDSDASSSAPDERGASSSESDADDSTPHTAHQHSLAALEAALQKDPTSLPTWFTLLDQTLSTVPPSAKSSLARARAEIKLSVLDRAMRTHRQNKASVELRVKWLNAGAEVWDAEKLEREWESAVRELGSQSNGEEQREGTRDRMWDEWLRWRVSSAGKGTRGAAGVEGIIEDAGRVLENTESELAKVKILWRIAVVLKEAGFSERAMALLQAQAELIFNSPPAVASKPLVIRLDALEEFWEAEHPRIGEPNAQGWDTWEREGRPQPPPPANMSPSSPQTFFRVDVDTATDPYLRWAADEARADTESSTPKRTDYAGEDPYAMILFSDVRPLLVDLTTPEAKRAFRIAWLGFLGLHVPGFAASLSENSATAGRDDVWSHAHLARGAFLRRLFPPQGKGKEREWDAYAGTIVAREKTYSSAFSCVKEWGMGVFGPLEGVSGGEGRMWEERDVEIVDKGVTRRIFEQLRRKVVVLGQDEDEEWDVMGVAFEAATSLKSALKLSRTLLSTARDSLTLWDAHAHLERMRGKVDEGRRIYDTALSAAPTPVSSSRRGEASLWWHWAEMEWLAGEDGCARAVVLRAAGVDPAAGGAMGVLRAKRELEHRMRVLECLGGWKEQESWACLRALLEVLAGGTGAVEEAMAVLEGYVLERGLESVPRESTWTRMLLMGWKHANMLGRQSRRRIIREKVVEVVKGVENASGTDTVILGIFLEGEKGESVWGRVRALVGEGGGTAGEERGLTFGRRDKGVARRVWEVWLATWERGRWEAEVERVRNSMGIAVGEERTRASAILWRVYVEFEIYCGELKRAKSLLFRAIAECPRVKELYLLAFGPLRSVFTPRELDGWAETMAERGIRMHQGLDEYAEAGKQEHSGSESESEGEPELEREARDYRRLAPY